MSNTDWNNSVDDDDESNDSNLVNQLRKQNREYEKRTKAMEAELAQAKTETRSRVIKDTLLSRGVNAKVAKFIPADVDADEEAINAWLVENADVFGFALDGKADEPPSRKPDLAANTRINSLSATAETPIHEDDVLARIAAAKTPEELTALLQSQR